MCFLFCLCPAKSILNTSARDPVISLLHTLKQPIFVEAITWPAGPCMVLPPLPLTSLPIAVLIPSADAFRSPHSSWTKPCFCLSQAFAFAFSSAWNVASGFAFCFSSAWNVLPTNIHKSCFLLYLLQLSSQMSPFQWKPSLTTQYKIAMLTSTHRPVLTGLHYFSPLPL